MSVWIRDLAAPETPEQKVVSWRFTGEQLAASATPGTYAGVTLSALQTERVDFDDKLLLTQTLGLRLPFPEWAFFGSEPVPPAYTLSEQEIEPHYQSLLAAYERVWQLLDAKAVDTLMPLFAERSREIDAALYRQQGSTQAKLRESLARAVNDDARALSPIRPEDGAWKYDVGPTGKLLRLSEGAQSSAILRFPEKQDPRASIGYSIAFRKQGDQFIIAR